MNVAEINGARLHFRDEGAGAPVVFCNSLGTDLRLWDKVVSRLPAGLRIVRYDKRGHGLSDAPPAPYAMGKLVSDAEALMEHLGLSGAVFVGCSIGGMIAQGLAAKRPDLLSGVVLSNTATKIGTQEMWDDRIAKVEAGGVDVLADAVLERWFSPPFRDTPELSAWRNMLTRTPLAGYSGCSAAIAGTDFYTTTAALKMPVMGIGGDHDGSTPPDLVRETAELAPRGRFELIRGAGHLPMVEQPDAFARVLTGFLEEIGHV